MSTAETPEPPTQDRQIGPETYVVTGAVTYGEPFRPGQPAPDPAPVEEEGGLILDAQDAADVRQIVDRYATNDPDERAMRDRLRAMLGHEEGAR